MSDNLLDNDQLDPEMIRGLLELRKHFAKRKVCKKDKNLSSLIKKRFFTQALENGYGFCDFRNIEIIYSGCSTVGSMPGLGPGGRQFESGHPDKNQKG